MQPKYNPKLMYESIEDRRPKHFKYREASALYQWVKNRNGKIRQRTDKDGLGVWVTLVEPIQLPSRTYTKKEIFFFIEENKRLKEELDNVKDTLTWYKKTYDTIEETSTEGWNNGY